MPIGGILFGTEGTSPVTVARIAFARMAAMGQARKFWAGQLVDLGAGNMLVSLGT